MIRTSLSHPLAIAKVDVAPGLGRIGVTFCPGKCQPHAATGAWRRDLHLDLDAIRDWGAAVVVTLVEDQELDQLGVRKLGDEVLRRHMDWLHLPITDISVPGARFEEQWRQAGAGLRARLRDGFNILVHCKGGLGRAGLVAARLLIELGYHPDDAMTAVRDVRPGAIETVQQEHFLRQLGPIGEAMPARTAEAMQDRAAGSLLGLAVGDAVGTTLEFSSRDAKPALDDLIGGGPFSLAPGEWTDDTAMALALADSLARDSSLNERDLMDRFVSWYRDGIYSCTGHCFDIGVTTRQALARYERTDDPIAGDSDPQSAGNGSLMRLAPVAIRHRANRAALADIAARQSCTTHAAPQAVAGCVAFADVLADALLGEPRSWVLRTRNDVAEPVTSAIMAGSWRGKGRPAIRSSGYVAHSLEAALWCVGRTANFRDAILLAANLGEDADTTAAITGQLAGALYGVAGIPDAWLSRLAWRKRLEAIARELCR